MTVFVDTSALYAVLDRDDDNHDSARAVWQRLLTDPSTVLVTHNYVLVETAALVQNRQGIEAVRTLQERIVPVLQVAWLDEAQHRTAVAMTLAAGRRKLSLVDCASFLVMRENGIRHAFCFDRHFAEEGFAVLPEPANE